jgi:hypothetical protein
VSGAGGGGGGYSGGKAGRKRAQGDPWISAPRLCPQSISPFRAHPTPVGVKCHVVPVPLSSFLIPPPPPLRPLAGAESDRAHIALAAR